MIGFLDSIKNNYLATCSELLPFVDAQQALDFVFNSYTYQVPFWPSLPNRSFFEEAIVQFSEKLPGIQVDEAGKRVWVDTQDLQFDALLEECFNRCMALDVDYFAISPRSSSTLQAMSQRLMGMNWQGWIKVPVPGPLSASMKLCDEKGVPIFFHETLEELFSLILPLTTAWLIKQFRANAKTKIIVDIDESSVCLKEIDLTAEEIFEKINCLIDVIHDNGALCALRVSDNKDFVFAQNFPIDLLHFDIGGDIGRLGEAEKMLAPFLKKGGMPILGILPTDEAKLNKVDLKDYLFASLKSRQLLMKNGALITTDGNSVGCSDASMHKMVKVSVDLAESLRLMF
ncbi:MAG: hypothetical protein ABIC68_03120 [Candidatus Omnitrophota bacterium]